MLVVVHRHHYTKAQIILAAVHSTITRYINHFNVALFHISDISSDFFLIMIESNLRSPNEAAVESPGKIVPENSDEPRASRQT